MPDEIVSALTNVSENAFSDDSYLEGMLVENGDISFQTINGYELVYSPSWLYRDGSAKVRGIGGGWYHVCH